jgi:hypothetical protein
MRPLPPTHPPTPKHTRTPAQVPTKRRLTCTPPVVDMGSPPAKLDTVGSPKAVVMLGPDTKPLLWPLRVTDHCRSAPTPVADRQSMVVSVVVTEQEVHSSSMVTGTPNLTTWEGERDSEKTARGGEGEG